MCRAILYRGVSGQRAIDYTDADASVLLGGERLPQAIFQFDRTARLLAFLWQRHILAAEQEHEVNPETIGAGVAGVAFD